MGMRLSIKDFKYLAKDEAGGSSKSLRRQNRKIIHRDFVVDPNINYNTYLIKHGVQQAENVVDGNQKSYGKTGTIHDEGSQAKTATSKMADNLLRKLNVTVSSIPKDHTLLYCQFDKPDEENPNIYDKKDFENTKNEKMVITDNFPDKADPIYNLDTAKQDHNAYYNVQREINRTPNRDPDTPNQNNYNDRQGMIFKTPDMTFIAASVVYLNFTNDFSGLLKYFTPVNNPLSERSPNNKVRGSVTTTQKESDRHRYGEPIEINPYETINPNKEDYHAVMITSDLKRSGKNVGIYVQGANIKTFDTSQDSLRRNNAGIQRRRGGRITRKPNRSSQGPNQGGY